MIRRPNVVITGANRGIGLALAQHYAGAGYDVTAIVRRSSPQLEAIATTIIDGIELTGAQGIAAVAAKLKRQAIDLLLNVAGIMQWETLEELNFDKVRTQLEVNALAPLALSTALIPNMGEGAKIVFLTSRLGSIADSTSGKGYGYRISKAALNMAAKTLSVDLKSRGIHVGLLHPGSVKTSLNKLGGQIEVSESVAGLTARINELSAETSGKFLHQNGSELAW
ncbi:MAG: short-chain dehydrogenase [Kordiimonadales bacterium]|nr:MAG: short-chain dehydrogenase [Kordiimonadales bacterium]